MFCYDLRIQYSQKAMMKQASSAVSAHMRVLRSQSRKQFQHQLRIKEKQQEWNNRFFLERIPTYDYYNDPYSYARRPPSAAPMNPILQSRQNRRALFAGRKVDAASNSRKSRESSHEGNKVSNRICLRKPSDRQKQAIRKAFTDLKRLWLEKNIPESHIEAMTKVLTKDDNLNKVLEELKIEYTEIARDASVIQKLVNSVEVREGCLKTLASVQQMMGENSDIRRYASQIEEKIQHLRILTIHCVECILQWKQQIWNLRGPADCVFIYRGRSYLDKIKHDFQWVKASRISGLYQFPQKNDFFLSYIKGRGIAKPPPPSQNLLKRIRHCEQIMVKLRISQRVSSTTRVPLISKLKSDIPSSETQLGPPTVQTAIVTSVHKSSPTPKEKFRKHTVDYSEFQTYVGYLCKTSPLKDNIAGKVDFMKYQECVVITIYEISHFVIAIDRSASHRKVVLLMANCTIQNFPAHFEQVSSYLWTNDHCQEIRIGLYHTADSTGNISVPENLQQMLRNLKFKWVCVCNNDDGVRFTSYSLKRPYNIQHPENIQQYPLIVQQFTVFKKMEGTRLPNSSTLNILFLLRLVCDKGSEQQQQDLISDPDVEPFLVKLDNIARFKYSGLKSIIIKDKQQLKQITSNGVIKPQLEVPCLLSFLNTSYRFRNRFIVDDGHMKFFPDKDNEIMVCDAQYPVYLLPTDEESLSLFLFQVGPQFTEKQIQTVFNGRGSQASFSGELWMPLFRKEVNYADDLGFENRMLVTTNFKSQLQCLTSFLKPTTKVIKPPFVFGLTHRQLLQTIEVPFFATIVTKQFIV